MTTDSVGTTPAETTLSGSGVVAGIGLRRQTAPDEILALLDLALAEASLTRGDLVALVTWEAKAGHPALCHVATLLDIPLRIVSKNLLVRPVPNPSGRVADFVELPSVAEAAASVFGPLIVEKRHSANATCAIARVRTDYRPASPSADSMASMLSSSRASA